MFDTRDNLKLLLEKRNKELASCCDSMRRLLHHSPHGILIIDADRSIRYANPPAEKIFACSSERLLGKQFDHAPEAGTSREVAIRRHDHGETIVEVWSTETEWQGGPAWLVSLQDVTERKQYEEQLRSSERQLAEAQKIAHLGSWKRYLDSGKSYWSDEMYRILGFEPGTIPPSHERFLAIVHPDDREKVRLMAVEALKELRPFSSYFCRIVRPDGSLRILLGQGDVVRDAAGHPWMYIGTALDVTERKLMEEEIEKLNAALKARAAALEAANRELESFSYTVCHDLRSPLTNIHGYCQVLSEMCADQLDTQCKRYLREIARGTERMNELIETLLDFSLITRGQIQLGEVDLSELATEIGAELQLQEPERMVELKIAAGVTVRGDHRLLRIMLRNLLGNAWKYTVGREAAVIEVGTLDVAGVTSCYVRDNGIGFDRKDARKLFAPFQRLQEADAVKGHGIGLATVQRIVERHGGRVWAEGEPGKGATFFFTLSEPVLGK